MKKILIYLMLVIFVLPSCKKEQYKILYDESGEKVTQLFHVDKENKKAYLQCFTYPETTYFYDISENIANFYNIEGYDMFFYDSLSVATLDKELEELYPNVHITPFQYRKFYTENCDTIAKAIERTYYSGSTAHLLTNKKYSYKDSLILRRVIDSLGLDNAYFYDHYPERKISFKEEFVNCYSFYSSYKGLSFWDNIDNEERFTIDGIHVQRLKLTNLAALFVTNKYLSKEQILRINEREDIHNKILYFYLPSDLERDYGSLLYRNIQDEYSIYMFNEKKTYCYNKKNKSWSFYNHE